MTIFFLTLFRLAIFAKKREMARFEKEFMCSDESVNTYGFRLLTSGGKLDRFLANPVMLYSHDDEKVIGRWEDTVIRDGKLFSVPHFDSEDPEAAKIEGKVKRGMLRMCSVGTIPKKVVLDSSFLTNGEPTPTVTEWELREISITPFGANKNAIMLYDQHTGEKIDLSDRGAILRLCDNYPENQLIKNMELNKILNLSDKATDVEIATAVQAIITERDSLKEDKTNLTARAEAAEKKVVEFESSAKAARTAEATNLTDVAIAEGRINAAARPIYLALFDKDHEGAKAALAAIPKRQSAKEVIGAGQGNMTLRDKYANLSWDELDRQELLANLKAEDSALYAEKYEAKFNRKPTNQ